MRIPNYLKRILSFGTLLAASIIFGVDVFNILQDVDPQGVTGEIIGGIATSAVIFLFVMLFRPIIEISPKIACITNDDGTQDFIIKMYNSGFLPFHDVRTSLTKVTYIKGHNGKMHARLQGIPISFSYIEFVPSVCKYKAHKQGGEFAVQYRVLPWKAEDGKEEHENVKEVLAKREEITHYRLTISCQGWFSGIRSIRTENFTYKSSIVDGEFKSGATFVIK